MPSAPQRQPQTGPAAVAGAPSSAFSLPAQRYFAEHAIDPAIAARCGVSEATGALIYPYTSSDGRRYVRVRRLGPGKAITEQPRGEALSVWWPDGRPTRRGCAVVVCEGEPDALAALTALHGPGGDLQVAVCCVPGASFPADRLLEDLAASSPRFVLLVPDGDDAGREFAGRVLEAARRSPLGLLVAAAELDDGVDLADTLRELDPAGPTGGDWLCHLAADYELAAAQEAVDRDSQVPVERRVTDRANAQRLTDTHYETIRFVHDEKRWRVWDGARWAVDGDERMLRLAMQTAQRIYDEADRASSEDRKALLRHAQRSENASRLRAMVELAKADERVAARREDFDADPMLLNCANGIVDLRTGALREHDPELACSHFTTISYDPDLGEESAFADFVWQCVGGDQDYYDWLRRAIGYSLTGRTDEEALFLLHGPGGTGKSTLLAALEGVWGSYARSADVSVFVHQQAGRPRNDVARLRDARLVCVTEVDERAELAAALVKRLTGGDTVAARFLFSEEFEFKPQLKLWIASNHLPAIDSRDSGMFRRLRILPFDHAPVVSRPQLKRDLTDTHLTGAQILAWAVAGAIDWRRRPLDQGVPAAVAGATRDFAQRSDPVGCFMADCLQVDEESFVASRELYGAFRQTAARGARPVSETEFSRRLKASGVPFARNKAHNGFHVRLVSQAA